VRLPGDHDHRVERARLALRGTAVGDAFGQTFFGPPDRVKARVLARELRSPPWRYTDDTVMALGITRVLERQGEIVPDLLARTFADAYLREPDRGYGATAHKILQKIGNGVDWREASRAAFGGAGSMGNGAAMRAAPLGGYFAEDPDALVEQARLSAQVTHQHPEGQAGAIAVALAASWAWLHRDHSSAALGGGCALLEYVVEQVPEGATRAGLMMALKLPSDTDLPTAVAALGNGSNVCAHDTVPLVLWSVARHLDSYEEALWTLVAAQGDQDTTCAIAGGILALRVGPSGIPDEWESSREQHP